MVDAVYLGIIFVRVRAVSDWLQMLKELKATQDKNEEV